MYDCVIYQGFMIFFFCTGAILALYNLAQAPHHESASELICNHRVRQVAALQ